YGTTSDAANRMFKPALPRSALPEIGVTSEFKILGEPKTACQETGVAQTVSLRRCRIRDNCYSANPGTSPTSVAQTVSLAPIARSRLQKEGQNSYWPRDPVS